MKRSTLFCLSLFICLIFTHTHSLYAEDLQKLVLLDTATNTWVDGVQIAGKEDNQSGFPWYVKKETLVGGKQAGVDLVEVHNGQLTIRIIPTRGMNILDVTDGDLRLGWDSPVKEVVHPQFIDLESRGGLGWLEGFNEWLVRCGLEFAGHPGTDEFISNTGEEATMDLTLHGKIGNIPASKVEILIDQDEPYTIRVRGTVYESFFYGPKLQLVTELAIIPGESQFTVTDTVTNLGSQDQEFQLIYHTNYGSPLLEEGAKAHVAIKKLTPMNSHADESISDFATYKGPTTGFIEEVFLIYPLADDDGNTHVCLQNAAGDRAASVSWNTSELPYFTLWKNTASIDDGYVTGLEPATGFPFNRKVERKFGRVPKLKAGESRSFSLKYGILNGEEAVSEMVDKIAELQATQKPVIEMAAPKVE